jgi:DNA-binding MarR family transcriptional regulator
MPEIRRETETEGQLAWSLLLLTQARLIRATDEELAAAGVVPSDLYDVLLALDRAPDRRLRLSDLADHVVLSRSGLTRLVDRLEQQGLLRRERCPEDRRGAFAVLTEAGLAALRKAWPVYRDAIERHFVSHLTGEEAATLRRVLARVLEAHVAPVELTVRGTKRP